MSVDLNKCILCSWDGDDLYRKCDLHTRIDQLVQRLSDEQESKDAYREAGAMLLQAFQKRFCFIEDTMEDCLKTVDMEAELILSKEKE